MVTGSSAYLTGHHKIFKNYIVKTTKRCHIIVKMKSMHIQIINAFIRTKFILNNDGYCKLFILTISHLRVKDTDNSGSLEKIRADSSAPAVSSHLYKVISKLICNNFTLPVSCSIHKVRLRDDFRQYTT